MGNQAFLCGIRDGCVNDDPLLCKRACGIDSELDAEISCDPAGVVFDETIRHLGDLDQLTFHFAGSANLAALRWLFVFGASPEVADTNGTTVLHVAARAGSLSVVQDLVRRGSDPNHADNAGWTALHVASCMGRRDVALYLLQSGARNHARNGRGQAPHEVCSHPFTKEIVTAYGTEASKGKMAELGFPTRNTLCVEQPGDLGTGCGAALHFEPFFVPRDAVLNEPAHRKELKKIGIEIFNQSPGHGLAFLVAAGCVRDYPVEINSFLVRASADPVNLGDFLGEDCPIAQTLRLEFLNSLPLLGTGVVVALITAFHEMAVPDNWLKVDRLTRGIAHFWWRQHDEEVAGGNADGATELMGALQGTLGAREKVAGLELQRLLLGTETLHRLMFSTLMLNRWMQLGQAMTLGEWVQLNSGIGADGNDVPVMVQTAIFRAISTGKITLSGRPVPAVPPSTPALAGWAYVHYSGRAQTGTGNDPAAWPNASPRVLAAQGGLSSVGRSAPLPGTSLEEVTGVPALATKSLLCSFDAEGANNQKEMTWLSLHQSLLFLSCDKVDYPPYAFVSLRHAALKEVDASQRQLVLTSRPDSVWPPLPSVEEEWLELCILLSDGRFQPLEAPHLELRLTSDHDFHAWAARLGELCYDDPLLRTPVSKASSLSREVNLASRIPDELDGFTGPPRTLDSEDCGCLSGRASMPLLPGEQTV
mmetsp:Transcript_40775/g.75831  ORF Transcript_40775/g.75831 Transcript_40775/m.75831 type:complete len:705 (+) Transcript_40775:115-2229(+)